ncbi:MAG: 1-acyl-sn-glycerol-3-phosphate acyltransferase [Deltaproteobacteria bacterium]|nr:MAG: 1-acyl-sn-glycerol-3-phosphate acyltransferase [Deltaproteobacteria bacterium]
MLRSLFFYIILFLFTIFFGTSTICVAILTRSSNAAHLVGRLWARSILFASGVRVRLDGVDNIDLRQAYVFAANHQSQFDIFALLGCLPVQFRWLAKQELFRIPILGSAMRGADYIPIDRSNRKEAFRSIDQAAARVRQGTSVVIFPEGTRSLDGSLKSFKKGGFYLAIKSGRPIVPVSISGTFLILPKKGFRIRPSVVSVQVGQPVPTEGITVDDRNWLISEVRRRIQENLPPGERGEPEPMVNRPTFADTRAS